jgi:hypothetical protein
MRHWLIPHLGAMTISASMLVASSSALANENCFDLKGTIGSPATGGCNVRAPGEQGFSISPADRNISNMSAQATLTLWKQRFDAENGGNVSGPVQDVGGGLFRWCITKYHGKNVSKGGIGWVTDPFEGFDKTSNEFTVQAQPPPRKVEIPKQPPVVPSGGTIIIIIIMDDGSIIIVTVSTTGKTASQVDGDIKSGLIAQGFSIEDALADFPEIGVADSIRIVSHSSGKRILGARIENTDGELNRQAGVTSGGEESFEVPTLCS